MSEGERKLAVVERIESIEAIDGADNIVLATVRNWPVVVKKDEFSVGDLVVYFEIDSLLDVEKPQFAFLADRGVRTDSEGNVGHVLKTIRLRKQYSQGLVVPVSEFPGLMGGPRGHEKAIWEGKDVTEELGVKLWEPPMAAELRGKAAGSRPGWIQKTDEERIQNVAKILDFPDEDWFATEKVDGSSTSIWIDLTRHVDQSQWTGVFTPEQNEFRWFGVASRNLDLKQTADSDLNAFWKVARDQRLHELMYDCLVSIHPEATKFAIQGETFGEGIQNNPLQQKGVKFLMFNLIIDGNKIPYDQWPEPLKKISVPHYDLPYPKTVSEAVEQVDGIKSLVNPQRAAEGVVWRIRDKNEVEWESTYTVPANEEHPEYTTTKTKTLSASWKAISQRYLLKHDT